MEPNEFCKDRKKIWRGDIEFPLTNNISNEPNCAPDEVIVWRGQKLTWQYLITIDECLRDEIAKDLLNYFLQYDWSRAFKYSQSQIQIDYQNLKNLNIDFNENKIINNSATTGHKILKSYFYNINKVKGERRYSVHDVLITKTKLWDVIRNRIGNTLLYNTKGRTARQWPMSISPRMVIQGAKCSGIASMGSVFKPAVAKAIYKKYVKENDNIYDYSCGFGGRLLGLATLGFKNVTYYGSEPCTETYDNLTNLIKDFNLKTNILKQGSEITVFDKKMNFIFSSPPYFDSEIFSDEETQSINKFPDYNQWLEGYWRQTVKNAKTMCDSNTIFAINVGNKANEKMRLLQLDMNKIISEEKFELIDTLQMSTSRSHLANKKNTDYLKKLEPIFIYKLKLT